jgi:Putative zinc-finger
MTHITDRIADFVFQELSAQNLSEFKEHVETCSTCRKQVEEFQRTLSMLKASPEIEPPRSICFEFEKPRTPSWLWRWVAPMAASAAVALAVVSFAPRQVQIVERLVDRPVTQPAAQPIDYQRIVNEVRAAEQAWLENELKTRDANQSKEVLRLRGELAAVDFYQHRLQRETWENARDVQLLAAKTDPGK